MSKALSIPLILLGLVLLSQCSYRLAFNDLSFPEELESVTVEGFVNNSNFVVPGLETRMMDALKDRFLSQTSLYIKDSGGQWVFTGVINRYAVTAIAPTGDDITALNRLTIAVQVDFTNTLDETLSWSKPFTRFADFESTQQLSDVEDALIEEINTQLVDDIFNAVASNW
jgi:hypothetical protein